uniref:Lysosomal associated membrane protein 2 n=1 Tax=Sarcophilus harrisii TaxID=9305 RepID=G3WBL3_SARHA
MSRNCGLTLPLLTRGSAFALLCLLLGTLELNALDVTLNNFQDTVCLHAEWQMNFTIKYETVKSGPKTVSVQVPTNVSYSGSDCGTVNNISQIQVRFGASFFWNVNFTREKSTYFIDSISFSYNTSDNDTFPDAKEKGVFTTIFEINTVEIPLGDIFRCHSEITVKQENVTHTYWDIFVRAFIQNNTSDSQEYVCDDDEFLTTVSTIIPATVPVPTTKPVPEEKPFPGTYSVKNGSAVCLLATMGLRLNITKDKRDENRFYLKGVNISLPFVKGSGFVAGNNNLTCWDAPLGSSYMCKKEDVIVVSDSFKINTFDLRVQPFNVMEGKYATAQECSLDDDSILIPVVVGAGLAGLILIIVVAYIIGRRKSYAGYQTL